MNKIVIITAPSGSGKTSLVREMLKTFPELEFSISACTRDKRENEIDGKDYYFMSSNEFSNLIKSQKFVEWQMVYEGKYYGTMKSEFERIWNNNKIPVVDIDVKGALSIKEKYPNAISFFIKVPLDLLKKRLEDRGTETKESINERVNKAAKESKLQNKFDLIILNKEFETAIKNMKNELVKYLKDTN